MGGILEDVRAVSTGGTAGVLSRLSSRLRMDHYSARSLEKQLFQS
jgi:hypothetical protein